MASIAPMPADDTPLWVATAPQTSYPSLEAPLDVDVAVVGGGIAGLTAALLAERLGLAVALLEGDRIATGTTAGSTVKVTAGHGLKYSELERVHDEDVARRYAAANQAGLEQIADLVRELQIDCGFERRRHIVCAETDDERSTLELEIEAEQRAGLPATFAESTDLPFSVSGCLVLDNQAQFHPRRYVLGLAEAFVREGGRIFEGTRALDVDAGDPCLVRTERGDVKARDVIVATHFPIANRGLLFAKMAPMLEHALAAPIDRSRAPADMYLAAGSAGWSIRTATVDGQDFLIAVGQKHKTGEADDEEQHDEALREWARERFGVAEVRYRWTRHDLWPVDGLPYIGRIGRGQDHVYVATGFGAWGMTNGTAAAMLLRDVLAGRDSDWAELYDPVRRDLGAGVGEFMRHNLKVAAHWVGDRLSGAAEEPEDLGRDEAAVLLGDRGEHIAAYRDERGELHSVSATCTHLGCLVQWNGSSRTWDCPCHGSRFDPDGAVVSSPAVEPLAPRTLEDRPE
jgi:glycine/D-amino acid oxidase-like deaminating enzyme/nitrite reductase/ring-hydroxylating ferredoxin subunit